MNNLKKSRENILTYIKGDRGIIWVLILGIVGILLLTLPSKNWESNVKNDLDRIYEYEIQLENKITELCSNVKGISNVKVSVYFDSGFETVYAYNEESKSNSNGIDSEKKYITIGSGNDESMVTLYEKMPNISGVAIVCSGGGNPIAVNEIIKLISSAFDVPKNKIYVAEGKK